MSVLQYYIFQGYIHAQEYEYLNHFEHMLAILVFPLKHPGGSGIFHLYFSLNCELEHQRKHTAVKHMPSAIICFSLP